MKQAVEARTCETCTGKKSFNFQRHRILKAPNQHLNRIKSCSLL